MNDFMFDYGWVLPTGIFCIGLIVMGICFYLNRKNMIGNRMIIQSWGGRNNGNVPQIVMLNPGTGQMPPYNGQMPPYNGQVPPNNGQMPPNNGQMPPKNGQVPQYTMPNNVNPPPYNQNFPPN